MKNFFEFLKKSTAAKMLAITLVLLIPALAINAQVDINANPNFSQRLQAGIELIQSKFGISLSIDAINRFINVMWDFGNRLAAIPADDRVALQQEMLRSYEAAKSRIQMRPLQQGDRGLFVGIIQGALKTNPAIYPEGLITGFYGPLTTNAVIRFQQQNNLLVTGTVDLNTLEKLIAMVAPQVQNELRFSFQ